MSRITLNDTTTATGPVKTIFDGLQRALGTVPNMAKAMAVSPAVLQAWAQFNSALGGASLDAGTREQIALAVAEYNACTYCLSAHTALGKSVGLTPAQLHDARHAESADPRTAAALRLAVALLETRGGISDADFAAARSGGLSEAQVAEVVATVSLNILTNFFNRAFAVDVDFPRVEPHDHAAAR